ncbi:MAG: GEVED domain-containing protein [Ferruginibacter sp.]
MDPILDGPAGADAQDMPFRLDYNTTVCTGTPAPGNTIASSTLVCAGYPFTLSPEFPTCGSGVTYQWQSSLDGTNFTDIAGATNSTYSTTQTVTTYYQVIVSCSGTPGPVDSVEVDIAPANQCYCIPGSSDCTDGDIITNVKLNQLNNTSDCEPDGFINYGTDASVPIPDIYLGLPNPIAVTAGGGQYDEFVSVWIDYDHNGTFDASEFTDVGTTTGGTLLANINVPATAPLGQARMRVRVQFFAPFADGDACLDAFIGFGETEDYLVNVVPCVQGVFDAQPVNTSVMCGSNAVISTSVSGSLISYQWQEKIGSGPWTNVVDNTRYGGATTNTLTITNIDGTWDGNLYRVLISGACTAIDFSDVVTLSVTPLVIDVDPNPYSTCAPIPAGSPVQLSITNVTGAPPIFPSGPLNITIPDADPAGITNTIVVPPPPPGGVITDMKVTLNIAHTWVGDLSINLKAPNGNILNLDYFLTATGGPGTASTGFTNTNISSTSTDLLSDGSDPYTDTFGPDGVTTVPPGFPPTGATSIGDATVSTFADLYSVPDGNWTIGMYDGFAQDEGQLLNWTLTFTYSVSPFLPVTGVWEPSTGLFLDPAGTVPYVAGTQQSTVYAGPAATTIYTVTVTNSVCPPEPLEVPVRILTADPTLTVSVAPYTKIFPGLRTMLTAKVDPSSSSNTFQWYHNGDTIPGANSSTYEVGFGNTGLGTYTVDLIDPTICSGKLSGGPIEITDSTSNTLFIWPNPNHGIFQVRYNDGLNDIISKPPYLGVYDSKGARLSNNSYKVTTAFGRMDVDMSSMPNGVYVVVLYDGGGKLIQSARVVIR